MIFTEDNVWSHTRVDELLMRLQSLSLLSLGSDDGSSFVTIHPLVQSFAQDTLTKEDFQRFHYMATLTLSGCIWDENPDIFRYLLLHIFEVESHQTQLHLNDVASFAYFFFIMVFSREALQRWKMVENGCQEQFGSDHQSTLLAAAETASCLRELGEYQSAESILQRIIPIQERVLGSDHRDTLASYNRYAFTLEEQGKYRDAEALLRKRLQSMEIKHGKTHKQTVMALSTLGGNLYRQERYSEAEEMLREAIPALRRTMPEDSLSLLRSVDSFAQVLMKLDKWDEAEDILRRLVQTRAKTFGVEDVNTLISIGTMSLCTRHRGDLKEAEKIQRSCLDLLSKRFTEDHRYIITARKELKETIRILEAKNKEFGSDNSGESMVRPHRNMISYTTLSCIVALVAVLVLYSA